ncbi:MAG: monovalent cation/H(+) antiporter subunit G [Desulfohalobiaceae bacterium]|nr:monovalent cation/H(+) antiporter subunit G [Desulfohalobiaceae bacterium]
MSLIITILVVFFLGSGLVFFSAGAVGIIRMPDFYSRMHPAGKLDTLGIMAMVLGLAIYNLEHFSLTSLLLSLKMLLIVFFVFLSSPTATHSIVDAGIRAGLRPWTREKKG